MPQLKQLNSRKLHIIASEFIGYHLNQNLSSFSALLNRDKDIKTGRGMGIGIVLFPDIPAKQREKFILEYDRKLF